MNQAPPGEILGPPRMASLATAVLPDESDEDDGDFVPQEVFLSRTHLFLHACACL